MKKVIVPAVMLAFLTACASGGGAGKSSRSTTDDGGSAILKVGKPYEILGQQYTPAYYPDYEETGVASWYGPGFHGLRTANGDKFNQSAMTAAHRTLPMPSVVEVTNLENGRKAIVTVNDRGPFAKSRIIDLSKAAADKLGVLANGTAQVRVKYLRQESRDLINAGLKSGKLKADRKTLAMLDLHEDGSVPPAPSFTAVSTTYVDEPIQPVDTAYIPSTGAVSSTAQLTPVIANDLPNPVKGSNSASAIQKPYTVSITEVTTYEKSAGSYVQVASFSQLENAQELAQKLASLGAASVKPVDISGRVWHRVRLGPMADAEEARVALSTVQDMGMMDAKIVRE